MKDSGIWRETLSGKINGLRVVAYIDYLNKMIAINLPIKKPEVGRLYYFKNEKEHIFPRSWYNKFILVRLYAMYPSGEDDLGNPWIPVHGETITQYTVNYWFYVLNVYDDESVFYKNGVMTHVPYLKGFRDVVNDNNYYAKMPLINEVTHWDNGIVSNSKVTVDYKLAENPDNWFDFKLTHETNTDKTFSIVKMLNEDHEHPER